MQTGEVFESFQTSPYLEQEEMYKYSIFEEAQRELRVKEWTPDDVGTGKIRKRLESSLFSDIKHNGRTVRNNLFDWRKRDAFVELPSTASLEKLFFDFYTDRIAEGEAFHGFLGSGLDYRLISYFFFIKDPSRFVPIAQSTFDRFFANKLEIDFRTVRRASWENYEIYLGIIENAHEFLIRVDPHATFLDAHSFIWIVARQREEWLSDQGREEERLEERHFLQYWLLDQVETVFESDRELEHGGSNQYDKRGVKVGDVVWIVTLNESGEFVLAGRIGVEDRVTYDQAVAMYPTDEVFEKRLHIIASKKNAELMREIVIGDIAEQIRFESANRDRLTVVDGGVDPKQLQTIRRLTPASAMLMTNTWMSLPSEAAVAEKNDEAEEERIAQLPINALEKEQLIKARRGQGRFKQNLWKVESRCRVTGVADSRFLIASHIKAWRESSNKEKLDGNNGLLLSPHVDKLFDLGFISFSDSGDVLCRSQEVKDLMKIWNLDPDKNVGPFNSRQKEYLAYHRTLFALNSTSQG